MILNPAPQLKLGSTDNICTIESFQALRPKDDNRMGSRMETGESFKFMDVHGYFEGAWDTMKVTGKEIRNMFRLSRVTVVTE